jgi:hypothetical protein
VVNANCRGLVVGRVNPIQPGGTNLYGLDSLVIFWSTALRAEPYLVYRLPKKILQ